MSDLISREHLLGNIDNVLRKLDLTDRECCLLMIIRNSINEQPTAYNVEKVVAELENHKDCYEKVIGQVIVDNYDINLERVDLMNCAIAIARNGGKE